MVTVMAAGVALVVVVVVVIAGGWRLVVLDRELARMDDELARLQDELHDTQQQLRARDERVREAVILARQHQHYLDWADRWLRHWMALSQEGGR